MSTRAQDPAVVERIATVLLVTVAVLVVALAVAGWGWWRAATAPVAAAELDAADRQRLIQEMIDRSPGEFRWTFFEPRVGYTLKPETTIELFGDTFRSNALGMRSGPVAKPPGVFRVLCVGDSWTYGMGVREDQAFPARLAELADRVAASDRPIEVATLALPGWNAINQVAALELYLDDLDPDAVVFVPTTNDHHSTGRVLPNGSVWWGATASDFFGDRHTVAFPGPYVDTYRSRQRWLQSFAEWRRAEERLIARGVPTAFFFVARWYEAFVHLAVRHVGIESPYLVMPRGFTLGEWANPPPFRHASPAGYALYARSVYRLLAGSLGWRPLAAEARDAEIPIFESVPTGRALAAHEQEVLALFGAANNQIPTTFTRGPGAEDQASGPIDARTGAIGRSTTLLVRRGGARSLRVVLGRLEGDGLLYPLDVTVRIPSPSGGTLTTATIRGQGRRRVPIAVPVPDDLGDDAVLDVQIDVSAVRSVDQPELVRSVSVIEIVPIAGS